MTSSGDGLTVFGRSVGVDGNDDRIRADKVVFDCIVSTRRLLPPAGGSRGE